ncbi:MAG: hypothetical protein ACLFQB_00360 [Chitinispirillaceae bacterium]
MTIKEIRKKEDFSVYHYFNRSFYAELLLFLLFGPMLVLLWFTTMYAYQISGIFFGNLTRSAVYITLTSGASLFCYLTFRRSFKSRGIIVEKNRIVKKSSRGISAIQFEDITGYHHLHIPLIKGFLVLESERGTFHVPLFVQKSQEMISRIFTRLEKHGLFFENSSRIREHLSSDARKYNKTRTRRIRTLSPLLYTLTGTMLFGTFVAALYWNQSVFIGLLFGSGSMIFPLVAYFITDKIISMQQSQKENGSVHRFYTEYLLSGLIVLMIYMTAASFFRNLFFQ